MHINFQVFHPTITTVVLPFAILPLANYRYAILEK
jgi:hypothetical protein